MTPFRHNPPISPTTTRVRALFDTHTSLQTKAKECLSANAPARQYNLRPRKGAAMPEG
jgi:hypothetical protein